MRVLPLLLLYLPTLLSLPLPPYSPPSSPSSSFYTAAVVEHYPSPQASKFPVSVQEANFIIYQNLLTYEQHIRNATQQGAQIIVFPEYGLFGSNFNTRDEILPFLETIPEVSISSPVNPCANPQQFTNLPTVFNISCLAQKYNIYLVIDLGDVQPCNSSDSNCPQDGRYQYNTLVAFSPDGELVGKYHKMHLYDEPYYDPSTLDPTYFDTNFGVRFGMMVCFDMIFTDPAIVYFDSNVTDVVYATEWENGFPILSALQMQQGWSRVFQANLLAAGTGQGRVSSGSGIYSQGTVLADYFNPIKDTVDDKLLVAQVPKVASVPSKSFPILSIHRTIAQSIKKSVIPYMHTFDATPGRSEQNVVGKSGALSCTFSYSVSKTAGNSTERYALIVYEAADLGHFVPAPFQYCGLIRCNTEFDVCEIPFQNLEASTVFDSFSISGNFNTAYTTYPLLFTEFGQLLPPQKLTFDAKTPSVTSAGEFGEILLGVAMVTMLAD